MPDRVCKIMYESLCVPMSMCTQVLERMNVRIRLGKNNLAFKMSACMCSGQFYLRIDDDYEILVVGGLVFRNRYP